MTISRMITNQYITIPGITSGKDTFVNFEGSITNLGVVMPLKDDVEVLVPWSRIVYVTRPKTTKDAK